jgi:voltage-gated potassium channel Kch
MIAIAALSMIVSPPLATLAETLLNRSRKRETMEEDFDGARGSVLVIGFGRFGQIASQMLLAEGVETTLIDADPDRVRSAARFGFKVYFGDGERLDILRAAGAGEARVILVCLDDPNQSRRVCELIRDEFPLARVHALAYDRTHAIALMQAGVAFQIRETFESAILCGRSVLEALGVSESRAGIVEQDVRQRDAERLELQRVKGIEAGIDLLHQKTMQPEPLKPPRREGVVES